MKPKNHIKRIRNANPATFIVAAIVVCFSHSASASDWNGSISADWNDNANWNGGGGTGGSNAVINNITTNFAKITANIVATPVDIIIGSGGGTNGRLDHISGNANTGDGNWMYVGNGGGNGVYNLADTTTVVGGNLTGFAQGSGNMTSNRFWVGGVPWNGGGTGVANINTSGIFEMNDLTVGDNAGTGVVNVDSGTINSHGWNFIGKDDGGGNGAHGTLNMAGGVINNTGRTWVGMSNTTGVMNLSGGSYKQLNNEVLSIGDGGGGNGTVTISNSASLLQANGELWVGQNWGTGLLTFSAGSITSGNWVAVGRDSGTGTVNMTGGTWTKTGGGSFIIGASGPGTMTQNAGLVDVQNGDTWMAESNTCNYTLGGSGEFRATYFQVARNGSSIGNVYLNGGTLRVNEIVGGGGTEHVHFNGTQIIAKIDEPNFIAGMDSAAAVIDSGGLKIDSAGHTLIVPQNLGVGTGGGVVKSGAGKLTLSGTNTYTGGNTVNGGELVLKATSTGGGPLTLANGTTLSVAAQSAGATLPSTDGTFGTSTTVNLNLGDVAGVNPSTAILALTGNLVVNGDVNVNITGSRFQAAHMPLVSYNGSKSGFGNFVITSMPAGVVATLVDDTVNRLVYLDITSVALPEWDGTNVAKYVKTGALTLASADVVVTDATNIALGQKVFGTGIPTGTTVSGISGISGTTITLSQAATVSSAASLVIFTIGTGTNDGVWDVNTTDNWVDQVTLNLSVFKPANPVLFSDLATGPTAVVLDSTALPSEVIFNNSTLAYSLSSLSGSGKISGTSTFTKSGTGTVTVNTANDYTGVTTLAGGTTTVGTLTNGGLASPLGAATLDAANLVLSGGTLNYTGATVAIDRGFTTGGLDGAISVPGGTDLTMSGPVTGGLLSSFNKMGSGSLILTNSSVTLGAGGQVNEVLAGTLKFSGPGQTVAVPGELWVGSVPTAAGHLVLDSTSLTVGGWFTLGRGNGNTSLLSTITATNSTLVCGSFSTGFDNGLPNDSDQTVNLTHTTWTTNGSTLLGEKDNATTTLTIDGTSVFNANGRFLTALGNGSVVNITVQGALNHTAEWMSVGNSSNGICTMAVTGTVNSSGDFNVGDVDSANGTLNIQSSGAVTSTGNVYIGKNGTTGTVNMSGASTMSSPDTNVGGGGGGGSSHGHLNIGGTSVFTSNGRLQVGSLAGSTGDVLIEGSGSLAVNSYVSVGYNGTGSMTVKDSGSFTNNDDFSVNENGDAPVNVTLQDSGTISVGVNVYVGRNAGRVGTLTQTGGTFTGNGWLFQIGQSGTGTWLQSGGITNAGGWVAIGRLAGSTGVVTVSGTGTFNQTGTGNALIVGEEGTGTLNIQDGATVSSVASNGLLVSNSATGVGTVNLDGGTLVVRKVADGGGASTFNFNGGVLKAGTGANLAFLNGLNTVSVNGGGAFIDSNSQTIAIDQVLSDGGGSLTKQGAGTLQLNGPNSYLGTTMVAAGTLGGTGSVGGELVVPSGSSIAPGAAGVGTFSVDDAWGIGSTIGGTYACEISGATADKLVIGGALDITGATLDITELSAPGVPVFIIASYGSLTGTFATVLHLPSGYTVDYTYLGGNQIALVQTATPYSAWASSFGLDPFTTGAPAADPDGDGQSNLLEFALGGSPTSASNNAKTFSLTADSSADGDSLSELLLTIAVRSGTPAFTGSPSPTATQDGVTYTIEGSLTLGSFTTTVTPVTTVAPPAPNATPPAGYEYRTFSLSGSNGLPNTGFLRVKVTN